MESSPTEQKPKISSPTAAKDSSEGQVVVEESSMEVGASESADTLEDLVDQMEIEISDHGEEEDSEDTVAEESLDESPQRESQGEEKVAEEDKSSQKIQTSTTVSTGASVQGEKVKGQSSSEPQPTRRRRLSSARLERPEFHAISLDNQLSDDEILELMELLQVWKVVSE